MCTLPPASLAVGTSEGEVYRAGGLGPPPWLMTKGNVSCPPISVHLLPIMPNDASQETRRYVTHTAVGSPQ